MNTPKLLKQIINAAGAKAFDCFYRSTCRLSLEQLMKRARMLSALYFIADKKRIKVACRNLRLVFSEMTNKEIDLLVRKVIINFLYEGLMFFWLGKRNFDEIEVKVEGEKYIREASARGKGVIFLTAHYGNWEILARQLCRMNIKLTVVARNSDRSETTDITNQIRNSGGYQVCDRDKPLTNIIRILRRGEGFGILPDQHDYEGIEAKFFGVPAMTSVGTAVFSLRTGAAIVPVFCRRVNLGEYVLTAYPPLDYEAVGDEQIDRRLLTQLVNDAIEKEIRLHPENWLWVHDRWKEYFENQSVCK